MHLSVKLSVQVKDLVMAICSVFEILELAGENEL
jgi:hypothetical protein